MQIVLFHVCATCKLVGKKYLPFNFFDDNDTQDFFFYLNCTAEVQMRNKIRFMALGRFSQMYKIVTAIFKTNASKSSLDIDGWFLIAHRVYNGVISHFISGDWELHSLLVDFVPWYGEHAGKISPDSFTVLLRITK